MSLQDNTQNLILLHRAENYGHKFNREPGRSIKPDLICVNCGRRLDSLCDEAEIYTSHGKPIPRCKGEVK